MNFLLHKEDVFVVIAAGLTQIVVDSLQVGLGLVRRETEDDGELWRRDESQHVLVEGKDVCALEAANTHLFEELKVGFAWRCFQKAYCIYSLRI